MPRRKLTEEEIDDLQERGRARQMQMHTNPQPIWREEAARRERKLKRAQANLKKHQPVVKDMSFNGEFVTVEFIRNNGESVVAEYRLCAWGRPPANLWNPGAKKAIAKMRALDAAAAPPPPGPAETPRS